MMAGGWAMSFARSGEVISSAQPPSSSWQQSKSRSGSQIIREFM